MIYSCHCLPCQQAVNGVQWTALSRREQLMPAMLLQLW